MAFVVVNKDVAVKGKLSVARTVINDNGSAKIITKGVFATHQYFEEITELETMRYKLVGVEVFEESFGSDDYDIVYSFIANKLIVKGGATILDKEQMDSIESTMYDKEGNIIK